MAKHKTIKHLNVVKGRDNVLRFYYRRRGFASAPLRGPLGSAEFWADYNAASTASKTIEIGAARIAPGSLGHVIGLYLGQTIFGTLAKETQRSRGNIFEGLRNRHGKEDFAAIKKKHVQAMIDAKVDTPSAARNLLAALSLLMKFGIDQGLRKDNPTIGVKRAPITSGGHETWEEEHIAAFEAKHPIGTRARLAFELLLYTGQRRGDVVGMGRQHVRNGLIAVQQQKTDERLLIPIHPKLRAAIAAVPADQMIFLVAKHGGPFTPQGFTNWFRRACNEAGIKVGLSAHGLRKAMCRRLAEAGCSHAQIMAISGHKTPRMVQVYIDAANQERLARDAMAAIGGDVSRTNVQNI
jgi:integrase